MTIVRAGGKARVAAASLTACLPITRVYVDTGPVFEREWASKARLGWFGRNTNLLNHYHGSYFFLAEIFTDLDFDRPPEPYRDHCGTCRRCLDLCPTGALADGYFSSPACAFPTSRSSIGSDRARTPSKIGNWIFGCDICQEVCPWNGDATRAKPSMTNDRSRRSRLLN